MLQIMDVACRGLGFVAIRTRLTNGTEVRRVLASGRCDKKIPSATKLADLGVLSPHPRPSPGLGQS